MDLFNKCETYAVARDLRAKGIYPYFHALESRQDVEVIMEGKRRIMLGSNNYLGLTTCPEVLEAGLEALKQYGTGCSGSRFLNGTLKLHLQLEEELADFLHKEACCTFSTGFQSNLGIISAIVGHGDYVICDKENHASIYDGCKLSYGRMLTYAHANMEELEIQLKKVPESAGCLIVTDGVFSMGGDIAKLPEIVSLGAEVRRARDGRRRARPGRNRRRRPRHGRAISVWKTRSTSIMGTFSKSLASLGGYCVASETVIDLHSPQFAPVHLLRVDSAGFCGDCAGGAQVYPLASGARDALERDFELYAQRTSGEGRSDHRIDHADHSDLHLFRGKYAFEGARAVRRGRCNVNPVLAPATPPDQCLLRTQLYGDADRAAAGRSDRNLRKSPCGGEINEPHCNRNRRHERHRSGDGERAARFRREGLCPQPQKGGA